MVIDIVFSFEILTKIPVVGISRKVVGLFASKIIFCNVILQTIINEFVLTDNDYCIIGMISLFAVFSEITIVNMARTVVNIRVLLISYNEIK